MARSHVVVNTNRHTCVATVVAASSLATVVVSRRGFLVVCVVCEWEESGGGGSQSFCVPMRNEFLVIDERPGFRRRDKACREMKHVDAMMSRLI